MSRGSFSFVKEVKTNQPENSKPSLRWNFPLMQTRAAALWSETVGL